MQDATQKVVIRRMNPADLTAAAKVHEAAFVRQCRSYEWLECNLNASPRVMSYVAITDGECVGYAIWTQKSGFRPEVVLELEQIAVAPNAQGQGIGSQLIKVSLPDVRERLSEQGSTLKHVIITTRKDNQAQRLYAAVLGAEVEATISNLYSADEVIMVARNVQK